LSFPRPCPTSRLSSAHQTRGFSHAHQPYLRRFGAEYN
jgi:hypothetical protein